MKTLTGILLILAAFAGQARADATLTYELTGPDGGRSTKTFALSSFFVRVVDTAEEDTWLLYQAGKFFPLYEVDPSARTYTRLTPEVRATLGPDSRSTGIARAGAQQNAVKQGPEGETAAMEEAKGSGAAETGPIAREHPQTEAPTPKPAGEAGGTEGQAAAPDGGKGGDGQEELRASASRTDQAAGSAAESPGGQEPPEGKPAAGSATTLPPKPQFRARRENREVAGIECRVVEELRDGNTARLGLTERELRTLARTFVMARERGLGWLGAATEDEEFVSIQARVLETDGQLVLRSVSTAPLPEGHLRIPHEYEQTNR